MDRTGVPDELVEALVGEAALTVGVRVEAVVAPAGWPSMRTRNGMGVPRVAGPITRFTSRAWYRNASRPPTALLTEACAATVQSPIGDQRLRPNAEGSGKSNGWSRRASSGAASPEARSKPRYVSGDRSVLQSAGTSKPTGSIVTSSG